LRGIKTSQHTLMSNSLSPQVPESDVQSITQITRELKALVETRFPRVWVQGEISNCTRAGSGHFYLTLKDENAQLRAVIWRGTASRLRFDIHDGLEVIASGPIEIYQARGSYQLIINQLIPKGVGSLELAFRQMQQKLEAEGLFDPQHKRPLPRFPRRLVLVTSPTSAAVRDMLQVITRRWPAVDIVILPVAVQGTGAAEEIAAALRSVAQIPGVDIVITGRGGGSLEDLWAFNEEVVARAIFDCPIPVVSAVGHEIDVSIADLVADRRALTPSEAGELVVPNKDDVVNEMNQIGKRLSSALRERVAHARLRVESIESRTVFTKPFQQIHDLSLRLDECDQRISMAMHHCMESARQKVSNLSSSLHALSPLRVLDRGYSVTRSADTGDVIRSAEQLSNGDTLSTLLGHGRVTSRVEAIETELDPSTD